jgi:outer membrane protein OmpA-like peptidoglycan-associated protein
MTQPHLPKIPNPQPRESLFVVLLSFVFRLLLLGVGSAVAWGVGIAIAQVYPNPNPEMPIAQRLWQRIQPSGLKQTPPPQSSLPSATPAAPMVQIPLTAEQQQQATLQLQQLQQELNALIGRTAALELKMGISRPGEPIEQRLQRIEQQLSNSTPTAVQRQNTPPQASVSSSPSLPAGGDNLVVTLPSDILFEADSSTLRPGASVILDNLVGDLENYPGAAVQVAGHTDNQGSVQNNLSLSLQRAEAVVQYLSTAAGSNYHWLALGYGSGRPTVENDSAINQQLNRRIEVVISP